MTNLAYLDIATEESIGVPTKKKRRKVVASAVCWSRLVLCELSEIDREKSKMVFCRWPSTSTLATLDG